MMRVTRAGSCDTILWSWLAVLLGSSTVLMICVVTSGNVAIVVTFLTTSRMRTCGSAARVVDIDDSSYHLLSRRRGGDFIAGRGLLSGPIETGRYTATAS